MLFFTTAAIAQNPVGQLFLDIEPDITIKAEELKNYPSTDLVEMLIGRVPGISMLNSPIRGNQFTYVVDGFVWTSIDGLNIYNIEEIAYYRGGLNHKLGFQNNKPQGVIYIKTKGGQYNQPLQLEANVLAGLNRFLYEKDKETTYQSYQMALSQGSERLSWRTSLGYNDNTRNRYAADYTEQFVLNGDLRYQPASWLELGLNLNYAPLIGTSKNITNFYGDYTDISQAHLERDDWSARLSAKMNLGKGWSNKLSVLKNVNEKEENINSTSNMTASSSFQYFRRRENEAVNLMKNLSLINDLSYRFAIANDQINVGTNLLLQYDQLTSRRDISNRSFNFESVLLGLESSASYSNETYKPFGLAVGLSADFYKILNVEAGIRGDQDQNFSNDGFKYSPFLQLGVNLKTALLKESNGIDQFNLIGSYGKSNTSGFEGLFAPESYFIETLPANKMETMSLGFKSSFFSNRFHMAIDWYKSNYSAEMRYTTILGKRTSNRDFSLYGWRAWLDLDVFRESEFKWNTGIIMFSNRSKANDYPLAYFEVNKKGMPQISLQNQFSYRKWFLTANGYAYFNDPYASLKGSDDVAYAEEKNITLYNLNYLALGYDFNGSNTNSKSKYKVSLVSRNLLSDKGENVVNYLTKTFGIAINASF
jgi:hypothetical protein